MKRVGVAALAAMAMTGAAAAPAAQAQDLPGPCERAVFLIDKYGLYPNPGPYWPELDFVLRTACGVTG